MFRQGMSHGKVDPGVPCTTRSSSTCTGTTLVHATYSVSRCCCQVWLTANGRLTPEPGHSGSPSTPLHSTCTLLLPLPPKGTWSARAVSSGAISLPHKKTNTHSALDMAASIAAGTSGHAHDVAAGAL